MAANQTRDKWPVALTCICISLNTGEVEHFLNVPSVTSNYIPDLKKAPASVTYIIPDLQLEKSRHRAIERQADASR